MIERVLAIVDANPAARPDDRSLIWMIRACTGAHGPRAESLLLTVATGDDDSTGIGDIKHGERAKEPDWKRAFTLGSDLNGKRSEEHTSELQSLMRISYAVFCLKKQINSSSHRASRTQCT